MPEEPQRLPRKPAKAPPRPANALFGPQNAPHELENAGPEPADAPREPADAPREPALAGHKVLVTRSPRQAGSLSEAIRRKGGVPVEIPVIETLPPEDWTPVDQALERLASYDWLVFTSANAVRFFFDRLEARGPAGTLPSGIKVACVGTATARALRDRGVRADLLPEEFLGESLVHSLEEQLLPGTRVLFPAGNLARPTVATGLEKAGARVDSVIIYRTEGRQQGGEELAHRLQSNEISVVTLFSPSTVTGLLALLEPYLPVEAWPGTIVACIGPVTADAARAAGLPVDVIPEESTVEGLVAALAKFLRERPARPVEPPG